MMNDASNKNKVTTMRNIEVDDIYPNPLNNMPIESIEELAEVLKNDGQQTPCIVYKERNNHYILLSGERRWKANKLNNIDLVPCVIVDKPLTEAEERLMIEAGNAQREETPQVVKQRVLNYSEVYDLLKEEGKIEAHKLKRDWIGERMNMSGRNIQRYLTETSPTEGTEDKPNKKPKPLTLKDITKTAKKLLKQLEQHNFETTETTYQELVNLDDELNELFNEIKGVRVDIHVAKREFK